MFPCSGQVEKRKGRKRGEEEEMKEGKKLQVPVFASPPQSAIASAGARWCRPSAPPSNRSACQPGRPDRTVPQSALDSPVRDDSALSLSAHANNHHQQSTVNQSPLPLRIICPGSPPHPTSASTSSAAARRGHTTHHTPCGPGGFFPSCSSCSYFTSGCTRAPFPGPFAAAL